MNKCEECSKNFATTSNLNRHRKEKHNLPSVRVSYNSENVAYSKNFKCCEENCSCSFTNANVLRGHLYDDHNIDVTLMKELSFPTLEDFNSWLENEVKDKPISYYRTATAKDIKRAYYYCNRSGKVRCKESDSKIRNGKKQGSCKINRMCTSQIIISQNTKVNGITAQYFPTHYGHELDIQHVRIPKLERENIAAKLKLGTSVSSILNETSRSVGTNNEIKKTDFLRRKDIHNIKRSYKLKTSSDSSTNDNNTNNINEWVKDCEKNVSSPVLFFKPVGKHFVGYDFKINDFCLIICTEAQDNIFKLFANNVVCVDNTRRLNEEDFIITTIMVIDEFGESIPAAFMYSNFLNLYTYKFFFTILKEKFKNINPNLIMCSPVVYEAWCNIIGPVHNHLYSSWQIEYHWHAEVQIIEKGKKQIIYKAIHNLQYLHNTEEFETELQIFLKELEQDMTLKDFYNLFLNGYVKNKRKCTFAYRTEDEITVDSIFKNSHQYVKHFYLNSRTVQKIVKSIDMLLKFIRDKTVDRLTKLSKEKITEEVEELEPINVVSVKCQIEGIEAVPTEYIVRIDKAQDVNDLTEEIQTNALEIVNNLKNRDFSIEDLLLISSHLKIASSLCAGNIEYAEQDIEHVTKKLKADHVN